MPEDTLSPSHFQNRERFLNVQKEDKRTEQNKKIANDSIRLSGAGVQATGVGMNLAGKSLKAAGAGMTATGARLSTTGAGAVVGVPMAGLGRVASGTGAALEKTGKITSRAGRAIKRSSGSGISIKTSESQSESITDAFKLKRVFKRFSFVDGFFVSWLGILWFIQLMFGMISLGFLGMAVGIEFISGLLGTFLNAILTMFASASGISITGSFGSIFVGLQFMIFAVGVISLILVGIKSVISLKSPLWGSAAGLKVAVFLTVLIFYAIPIANLVPWAIGWFFVLKMVDD